MLSAFRVLPNEPPTGRRLMTMIGRWGAALGLALMTAACGSSDGFDADERATPIKRARTPENEFTPVELEATVDKLVAEINKSSIKPMQITVLLKDNSGFWESIMTAASRAMGELGITGNVIGGYKVSQGEQIEDAVANGVQGIGIAALDDTVVSAIDEAAASGVHVVTLDADAATAGRAIYVGSINESAGATAGETLLDMLPPAPGTVIVYGTTDPAWADGLKRTQGAQGVFEAAGYDVIVGSSHWTDAGAIDDIEWMRAQIETSDPPVVGMIGLFNISYRCAMAAEAAGRQDLPIVAFDFDPETVIYMRDGRIRATHAQRQYYEGYLVPYVLYGIENIGLDATKQILATQMLGDDRFDVGLDVVPANRIDAYYDFLDSIGAGAQ
ncbi:substrate-binding domain-containing protein [Sorangium sp. So ce1099]|uniref:substrate-binding domain-containing protein n=1 Tax=Sorangium sp. So ce1099 TaxID=3133331 RepID=UPI003F643BB0